MEKLVVMFVSQKPNVVERLRQAGEECKSWHNNSIDLLDFELVPGTMAMRKQQRQGKLLPPSKGLFEFVHYGNC